ncbi:unnamed protein product [Dovyalis caffra]|uniref:RING-CH-type domain-containing protein n=1 Tax=Dovyalis caffra TaxID=77055 RepID=A0AAV1SG29_9ROSI|nr:unnamed protein product [Dovyalis caffra]
MDQETHGNKGIIGNLGKGCRGRIENVSDLGGSSTNLDNGVAVETIKAINSGERVAAVVESGVLNANIEGLGSSERVANQGTSDGKRIEESLNEGTLANSNNIINGAGLETVIVMNSGATSSVNGEIKDLGEKNEELGLRGGVINGKARQGQGDGEVLNHVEQGSSWSSSNSIGGAVLETVIVIGPEENVGINGGNQSLKLKGNEMRSSKGTMDASETKVNRVGKSSCVIDMTCSGGGGAGGGIGGGGFKDNCDGERVCRICHLSSEGLLEATEASATATANSLDLIQIGCGCKDDLGIAHLYCAEAWFKLKGNR